MYAAITESAPAGDFTKKVLQSSFMVDAIRYQAVGNPSQLNRLDANRTAKYSYTKMQSRGVGHSSHGALSDRMIMPKLRQTQEEIKKKKKRMKKH